MQVLASNYSAVVAMAIALIVCGCGRDPVEELERRLTSETIRTISKEIRGAVREVSPSTANAFPSAFNSILTNSVAKQKWALAQGEKLCAMPFYARLQVRNSDRDTNASNNLTCFELSFWGVGEERSWRDTHSVWIIIARCETSDVKAVTANTIRNISRGISYGWNGEDNAVHVAYRCMSPFLGNDEASTSAYAQELQSGQSEMYLVINDGYDLGFRIGRKVYPATVFDARMQRLLELGYLCKMKVLLGRNDDLVFECIYE